MPNERKGRPTPGTLDEYKLAAEWDRKMCERRASLDELATLSKCLVGVYADKDDYEHLALAEQLMRAMSKVVAQLGYPADAPAIKRVEEQ